MLKDQISELKERNACLTKRIEALEDKSGDWTPVRNHTTAPLADVNAMTCTVADELQARKEKELNLVIIGLNERANQNDSDANTSEAEEKELVSELLRNIQVQTPNIRRVFRMGKPSAQRPRPLKVFCDDQATRSAILANSKKLKNLPNDHYHKKVFIRPDLTQMQRDQDYAKRQERRRQFGLNQPRDNNNRFHRNPQQNRPDTNATAPQNEHLNRNADHLNPADEQSHQDNEQYARS